MSPHERWIEIKLLEYAEAVEQQDFDASLRISGDLNAAPDGRRALGEWWRAVLVDLDEALSEGG